MWIKPFIVVVSFALYLSPVLAVADDTEACNSSQQGKCEHFCKAHLGVQSCIIDISTVSGTCTCKDGTSHTKS